MTDVSSCKNETQDFATYITVPDSQSTLATTATVRTPSKAALLIPTAPGGFDDLVWVTVSGTIGGGYGLRLLVRVVTSVCCVGRV